MSLRSHRGQHPSDKKIFSKKYIPFLKEAVTDLSYLQTKNYSIKSALKIVGDRYKLTERQQMAVQRASCSDRSFEVRRAKLIATDAVRGKKIFIDGFNILILLESALAGGIIFKCRDGFLRDIASIHGTYKKVRETGSAIKILFKIINVIHPSGSIILFDSPVSNSGRLKKFIETYPDMPDKLELILDTNPDKILKSTNEIIITSDGDILDSTNAKVFALEEKDLEKYILEYKIVSLIP